jgi:hypothetical protein
MTNGVRASEPEPLTVSSQRCRDALAALDDGVRALRPEPSGYEIRLTPGLERLRDELREQHTPTDAAG